MAFAIRPADIIKARVIDFLINKFDGIVIGNEVMYGCNHRIVDLLALYNGLTYAIEIKSCKDDLRRLPDQIQDYAKTFDYTLVFTSTEYLQKIIDIVQSCASVFVVSDDGSIQGSLRGRKNKTLKNEMLATMNAAYIRKQLNITRFKDSDDIRKKAIHFKKETIQSLLYSYFMEKVEASYRLFLNERVSITDIDDLTVLANRINVK